MPGRWRQGPVGREFSRVAEDGKKEKRRGLARRQTTAGGQRQREGKAAGTVS